MFVEELAPVNDFTRFIPDFMLDDSILPESIPSISNQINNQVVSNLNRKGERYDAKLSIRQSLGLISGLIEHQRIVTSAKEEGKPSRAWFKTPEVVDIRLLFRASDQRPDSVIGSKVRLYSLGRPHGGRDDQVEVQHLDSGFLHFNLGSSDPGMVFQNALASTMLFRSLYCIGGPATVRKISIPSEEKTGPPSYKWMSAVNPKFDESIDRSRFTHILHPALDAAGIEYDFFEKETLDDLVSLLTDSKDMKDVETRLLNLAGEDLDRELVMALIADSNKPHANLSNSTAKDFSNCNGINLVGALKFLADALAVD